MRQFACRGVTLSEYVMGTAQLGLDYGINNRHGQTTQDEANAMVGLAIEQGVNTFDTAQAYGNSETVLAEALKDIQSPVHIISKLDPSLNHTDPMAIYDAIEKSVARFGQPLYGMMLHRFEWLDSWDSGVGQALTLAKSEGLISEIGVSVYNAEEAISALNNESITMVQVPFNAWDYSAKLAGVYDLAQEKNKWVFTRSVYLQGVLTMTPEETRERLPIAANLSLTWSQLCKVNELSQQSMALSVARSVNYPLVIGAETLAQIQENCELFDLPLLKKSKLDALYNQIHPQVTPEMINPTLWT